MTASVAVAGYGAVGRHLVARLLAEEREVVVLARARPAALPAAVAFRAADLSDPASAVAACHGAGTLVCALGTPYRAEAQLDLWPRFAASLVEAATRTGARLLFADNLYMVGPQVRPLTEDMPLTAYGRKPRARALATAIWREAHATGRVRAASVRASDFYGPDAPTSVLSSMIVARLVRGRRPISPYPADQPHEFTYLPDFATALLRLIDAPDADYGQAWHVPNAPTRTLRDLATLAARLAGVPPRLTVLPEPLRRLLALASPDLAELGEMRFQWDRPYLVDASKYLARFGDAPTPFEEGLRATVDHYRHVA